LDTAPATRAGPDSLTPNPIPMPHDDLLSRLNEFLAIPSISTLPAHRDDCRRAATWLIEQFRALGCPVVELLEGDGHPVVWAESPHVADKPTVLCYGHYDVQPVDPLTEWVSPPFEPTVRDGNLYARGAVDDKGQVFTILEAYRSILDADGVPPLNVHFIIEGEEECGGRVIFDRLRAEPERTAVDAVVVADMGYYAPRIPAVYTGLRGLCYAEIHVRTLRRDLHSGSYGGVAPNALETLVRLLGDLKSRAGRIRVPKLYKSVEPPSKTELKAWRSLPFDEDEFLREEVTGRALTGIEGYSVLERIWALPTFEIHGIRGGFVGEGAKTVIPAQAMAKVSLRLVPGHRFEKVGKWLTKAIEKYAPDYADVEVKLLHGGDPVRCDVSHPAFAVLDEAFESVVGRGAVPVRAGGSIPVVPELQRGGAPVLLTGIGLPDDGLHSPNEKVSLQQIWDGIEIFAKFFKRFAESERVQPAERKAKAKEKENAEV
jgi:acetylornithine deacetylase/succinyl-diaminopimelate desuccinylase-like protein